MTVVARRIAWRFDPEPAYSSCWGEPVLRVVEDRDPPNAGTEAEQALVACWDRLTKPLPLLGGTAMAETVDGRVLLAAQLESRMPWMAPLAELIERECRLALALGRPWLLLPPVLLLGAPGVGKSYAASLIAQLSGCGHDRLDLAGISDNRTLEGTGRGWSTPLPSWPVTVIDRTRCANPLLLVDEIDKAGGSDKSGRPLDTLLAMTEPSTARSYPDRALDAVVNLGECSWIMCANTVDTLPRPLLSRVEVISVAGPRASHADAAIDGVLGDLVRSWGIPPDALPPLPRSTRRVLADSVAGSGSLRLLRRQLRAIVAALVCEPSHRRLS